MKANFEKWQNMKNSGGSSSSKVFAVYSAALTARQLHGEVAADNDIKLGLDYKIEESDEEN